MIKTSVIIPVYNAAPYLHRCVDSVLAQTQKELEIILIDDGSTDGSVELMNQYASRYPNIRVITQEHARQGAARNKGLAAAKGEYVYFLDSDDRIASELCETCYGICQENDLDFVTFDSKNFLYDESDRGLEIPDDTFDRSSLGVEQRLYTGPEFWSSYYNDWAIPFVCWLHYIRRDTALRLRFEEGIFYEDNDWTLRLYMDAERMMYLPEKLHRHCWRRNSTILSGFTVDHLRSCFHIHDVLCGIYHKYTDTVKKRMIRDVLRLNICRFDQLTGVEQSDKRYRSELGGFCDHLEQLTDASGPFSSMMMVHLAAAERILGAVRNWQEKETAAGWKEMIQRCIRHCCPMLYEEKTIGIYGTGKVSRCLVSWLERFAADKTAKIVFLHTDKSTGLIYEGCRVFNVDDISQIHPEALIIASIYYSDSIKKELNKRKIRIEPTIDVPFEIKFLLDNREELGHWKEEAPVIREPSDSAKERFYLRGLGWRCRIVLYAFPGFREMVKGVVDGSWPHKEYCGIPVYAPDKADWGDVSKHKLAVAYEEDDSLSYEDMMAEAEEHGCQPAGITTLSQMLAAYLERWERVVYYPAVIRTDISTLCQLNCPGCYMRTGNYGTMGAGVMTLEHMRQLVEANPGLKEIELSNSGEPFCNPEMYEIVELLREHQIRPQLWNGVNLNHAPDRVLEALVRAGTDDITVSIDGATQETYSRYRRGGDIEKVFENIRKINKYKEKYQTKYPELRWQYILMEHNQDEVEDAIQKAGELDMLIYFKPDWRGSFQARDPERLAKLTGLKALDQLEYETNEEHVYGSEIMCAQMLIMPQINWDGRVLGCCNVYLDDWRMNVFDTPLKELFNQPDYRAAVIALLKGKNNDIFEGPCRKCYTYKTDVMSYHFPLPL